MRKMGKVIPFFKQKIECQSLKITIANENYHSHGNGTERTSFLLIKVLLFCFYEAED
jgi:hypothetical protein